MLRTLIAAFSFLIAQNAGALAEAPAATPFPFSASSHAEGIKDYRARTVYFLLTDRFNPHTPYNPYVDPEYPDATNSVNCFVTVCTQE